MEIASVICTFGRPEYYAKAMEAFERCEEAHDIHWFVYQDGLKGHPTFKPGYRSITEEILEVNRAITDGSSLPIIEHNVNKVNKGINYQMDKALKLIHDYDIVFFFEDDIIVSRYYLRLLRKCAEQHPGIMGMFNGLFEKPRPKTKDMRIMLKAHKPRSWGFYLTSDARTKFYREWRNRHIRDRRNPYYDVVFTQTARKTLKGKYFSKIARAVSIGIDGVLSTDPNSWQKRNLHKQPTTIEYDTDETVRNFLLR